MLAIARYEILEGNKREGLGLCFVGVPCLIEGEVINSFPKQQSEGRLDKRGRGGRALRTYESFLMHGTVWSSRPLPLARGRETLLTAE